MKVPLECPNCKANLDDGDIYERLLEIHKDPDIALKYALLFDWNPENRTRFSKIMGIYCTERDRTIGWKCSFCDKNIDIKTHANDSM